MKNKEIIMLLQMLIGSQSWNLGKAFEYMGKENYNKLFEAMRYAKNLNKEKS